MNVLTIHGRLTKDPEIRTTPAGKTVASFTVAVRRTFKSPDGVDVDFFRCNTWEKTAEFLEKYGAKGSFVCVTGPIQSREWTNKEGNIQTSWEVNASQVDVQFKDNSSSEGTEPRPTTKAKGKTAEAEEFDPFADE